MRDPSWAPSPSLSPHDSVATPSSAEHSPTPSLFTHGADKGKGRPIDMYPYRLDDDTASPRRRARLRSPRTDVKLSGASRAHATPDRPRSLSRRRYRLPSPPLAQDGPSVCCCCDGEGGDDLFDAGSPTADRQSAISRPTPPSTTTDGGKPEWRQASGSSEEGEGLLGSSAASFAPSLSPSSSRTRLFDSDNEDYDDSPRVFSPITPLSFTSSLQRKTSITRAAISDPLLSPSSSPSGPTFSGGKGTSRRGRWVPAPCEPTSLKCTCAPELPDIVLVTVPHTPPASPPRPSTSPSPRPPSLLTKSLRSLSRLPNLTLPDLLPRLPTAEAYLSSPRPAPSAPAPELATLPPGWGPAERRRVLAAEPSHAADEARGFVLSLSLRRTPSARRRFPPAALVAARAVVAEVEAAAVASRGMAMQDMRASVPSTAQEPPPDDIAPLPPAVPPVALGGDPSSALPLAAAPSEPAGAGGNPAAPVARYISNPRHLLQLAIEFEMMRHAKIRGPLRQRAVIVRQATSPPRYGAAGGGREKSRLCEEVGA